MKMPQRVPQHVSETESFVIFSEKLPKNWIIRQVTERDYGIDCYLELVSDNNELTGELALIQLKSRQEIIWTKADYYTISDVDIATSNYWFRFQVPVFLFIADITNKELYFVGARNCIKRNFQEYLAQGQFSYRILKTAKFEGQRGADLFKYAFYYDYFGRRFDDELVFFFSNVQQQKDFFEDHWGRDIFLGVESDQLVVAESIYRNYKFLCGYLGIDWEIIQINDFKSSRRKRFGNDYDMYEGDLAELVKQLHPLQRVIIKTVKGYLNEEQYYWYVVNKSLSEFLSNLHEDGSYSEF
ncbi:DUF4365 domain-containing protein [Parachryseolinea silvisoli]|uniref:DUF4365 domain-containing protein n=1 Tax=Parachryseolinea silvisoli TaxID=2873601 RepID=UPI002265C90F|nr:DUF4365 domain-containing protein [Parachryseolinea silvisoli]MCD9015203.1 DUF4365 domain-containing protein [Parachryseolinea silvisoli]